MYFRVKKRIIFFLVIFFVSLGIEFSLLQFTNNKMYDVPENLVDLYDYDGEMYQVLSDAKESVAFDLYMPDIKCLYILFDPGSYISKVLVLDDKGDEVYKINNIGRTKKILIPFNFYKDYYKVEIAGNFKVKNAYISYNEPILVKRIIVNPLRVGFIIICIIGICQVFTKKEVRHVIKKRENILIVSFVMIEMISAFVLFSDYLYQLQSYYWLAIISFILSMVLLVLYRIHYIEPIEKLFFSIGLIFLVLCVFCYPLFPYGGDSSTHLARSLEVSQSYTNCTYQAYYPLLQGEISIDTLKEYISTANNEPIYPNQSLILIPFKNTRYWAYVMFAVGLSVADAVNCTPRVGFLMGELFNGAFVMYIYYCACKRMRGGKLILVEFASLPYILIMASKYSYTPQIIAWITYFSAYILGILQNENKIFGMKEAIKLHLCLIYGLLPKAPYMFVCALSSIIPKDRYNANWNRKKNVLLQILVIVLLLASLIVPMLYNATGFEMYSDTRGGEGVDAYLQMINIIHNPIWYCKILLKNLIVILSPESMIYGNNGFLSLGSALGAGVMVLCPTLLVTLFILTIFLDYNNKTKNGLNIKSRAKIWMITILNCCVICTVLYMNYTEVGEEVMRGINPLYLLTCMFPFFYSFNIGAIPKNKMRVINTYVYGIWTITLLTTVIKIFYQLYI